MKVSIMYKRQQFMKEPIIPYIACSTERHQHLPAPSAAVEPSTYCPVQPSCLTQYSLNYTNTWKIFQLQMHSISAVHVLHCWWRITVASRIGLQYLHSPLCAHESANAELSDHATDKLFVTNSQEGCFGQQIMESISELVMPQIPVHFSSRHVLRICSNQY